MKARILFILLSAGIFLTISCQKNIGTVKLKNELDTISYCIGITIGSNLMNTPLEEINYEALMKGIQDIFTNQELIINPYQANMLFTDYLYKLENIQYMENLKEGEEFLEENKARKDVVTLPSGLQYRVIREGTGPRPKLTDNVNVHYHGILIDGTVFDSSVERGEPVLFRVNGVIDGWKEALQLMPVGSKWELFIPTNLAYGARPPQGTIIEPNMLLIFEVELLSIEKAQD